MDGTKLEALGERIKRLRKEKGITQSLLAERIGIEPSNISHIEQAASKVGLGTLIKIVNALECSVDDLLCDSILCEREAFENELTRKHGIIVTTSDMTVDEWFDFWIKNLICDLAPNTLRNYQERYKHNIQPVIGKICISDVKPMHCKAVLNRMEDTYAGLTIRQAYITMGTLFKAAVINDMIIKHPMDGVRYSKPVRGVDDIKF